MLNPITPVQLYTIKSGFSDFRDIITEIKNDIILADKFFLPNSHVLVPFQRVSMRVMSDYMLIFMQAMRGASKSYLDARFCTVDGFRNKIKVVYTGPTYRQALHPFDYALKFIEENSTANNTINLGNEIEHGPVRGTMRAYFRQKNGTEHVALPMGSGENIRGERADYLIIDEFFNMEREMYKLHILPFLLGHRAPDSKGPKLILSTSAEYADCFAHNLLVKTILPKIIQENKLAEEDSTYRRKYIVLDWNIDDVRASGYEVKQEVLDLLLDGSSEEERQQALYNKWVGTSGEFFPPNILDRAISNKVIIEYQNDPKYPYVMAIDIATADKGDRFIIHILKVMDQRIALINTFWGRGLSGAEMAYKIHQFNNKFNPTVIVMDHAGGGLYVLAELAKSKLMFPDGSEYIVKKTLLEHDETGWLSGDRKIVLTRPGDFVVREAFAAARARGGELITTPDMLNHLMYDGFRQYLSQDEMPLLVPAFHNPGGDEERTELQIFELIHESVKQLRHLKREMKEFADGTKEIVKTGLAHVPKYVWKNVNRDAGVTLCYGYLAYLIHNKDNAGWQVAKIGEPVIQKASYETFAQFEGMIDYNEGQFELPWRKK